MLFFIYAIIGMQVSCCETETISKQDLQLFNLMPSGFNQLSFGYLVADVWNVYIRKGQVWPVIWISCDKYEMDCSSNAVNPWSLKWAAFDI